MSSRAAKALRPERRLGAGAVQQTESVWSQLIAMLELAQRWQKLIGEFIGEDTHPNGAGADDVCSTSRCSNTSQPTIPRARNTPGFRSFNVANDDYEHG